MRRLGVLHEAGVIDLKALPVCFWTNLIALTSRKRRNPEGISCIS